MYFETHRTKNGKKAWQMKTYRLLRNPICVVPILLFVFIISLYITLQAALHENYFPPGSFRFESHDKRKYYPTEFHGEKIVHLDFKGAPPKVHYLKQIFPIIAKFGATALLVEYEDMFPFEGAAFAFRSHLSYSREEVETINKLANASGLKIIPLVQTLSHMEYVLKYRLLSDLREQAEYPTDICPSHAGTGHLLFNITEQIIRAHPESTMVHIGADEVTHLGRCERCKNKMKKEGFTPQQLYMKHIKNVAVMIRSRFPNMTVLVWDDFLRRADAKDMIKLNLRNHVQPVVWYYDNDVPIQITDNILEKYRKVFGPVWFAGAFKGAAGPDKYLTQSVFHIHNLQAWLGLYRRHKDNTNVRGMILTGWQRFDHFSVLCELLPVSIPSLALTLALLHGKDVPYYSIPKSINEILNCQVPHSVTFFGSGQAFCSYPGGQLLDGIILYHEYKMEYEKLKKSDSIRGWLSHYNVKNGMYNMRQVESFVSDILKFRKKFDSLTEFLRKELSEIYQQRTVKEWLETYMEPIYNDISKIVTDGQKLMKIIYWNPIE